MMHFPQGLRGFVSALANRFVEPDNVIEAVIRSCANPFLEPGSAGRIFTWLGSFPRCAERYAISQLWLAGVDPTREHRAVARELAVKVAAEYALRDSDHAGLPVFGPATQEDSEWVEFGHRQSSLTDARCSITSLGPDECYTPPPRERLRLMFEVPR